MCVIQGHVRGILCNYLDLSSFSRFQENRIPMQTLYFQKSKFQNFFLSLFELRRKTRCALYRGMLGNIMQLSRPFQLLAFSRKSHPYANAIFSKNQNFKNFFQVFLSSGVKHDVRYIGACQGNIMQLSRPFQLLAFSRKSHPYANAIFSKIKISKFFPSLFELRRKTRCALYRGMLGEYYAIIQTFLASRVFKKIASLCKRYIFKNQNFKIFLSLFELRRKTRCALYRGMLGEYYAIIQTFLASRVFKKIASLCKRYIFKNQNQNFKMFFLSLFELRRKTRCALYRGMLGEYYAIIQTFLASRVFKKIASLCKRYIFKNQNFKIFSKSF